jgi:hypothetical protein
MGSILSTHKDLGKQRIRRTLLVDLLLRTCWGRPGAVHRDGGRVPVTGQEEEVEAEIPPTCDSLPAEERM